MLRADETALTQKISFDFATSPGGFAARCRDASSSRGATGQPLSSDRRWFNDTVADGSFRDCVILERTNYCYHDYSEADPPHQPMYLRLIIEQLRSDPTVSIVLDAGCGDGNFAASLAEAGFRMYGIDLSSGGIGRAGIDIQQYRSPKRPSMMTYCRVFRGKVVSIDSRSRSDRAPLRPQGIPQTGPQRPSPRRPPCCNEPVLGLFQEHRACSDESHGPQPLCSLGRRTHKAFLISDSPQYWGRTGFRVCRFSWSGQTPPVLLAGDGHGLPETGTHH